MENDDENSWSHVYFYNCEFLVWHVEKSQWESIFQIEIGYWQLRKLITNWRLNSRSASNESHKLNYLITTSRHWKIITDQFHSFSTSFSARVL